MKEYPDDRLISEVFLSQYTLPLVRFAHDIGLLAALEARPTSVPEIASVLRLSHRGADALCTFLTANGLIDRRNGQCMLSEVGRRYLTAASPLSWIPVLTLPRPDRRLRQIEEAFRPRTAGRGRLTDLWRDGQEAGTEFHEAMHAISSWSAHSLAARQAFGSPESLLDVAGGTGTYSLALARACPTCAVTLMDLEGPCERARSHALSDGLTNFEVHAADMFRDCWPRGYEAVLLANVLHDWDGPSRRTLLACARRALRPQGRVFVCEVLLDDDRCGPRAAAAWSIAMYIATDGQQLTLSELTRELDDVGLVVECSEAVGNQTLVTARSG